MMYLILLTALARVYDGATLKLPQWMYRKTIEGNKPYDKFSYALWAVFFAASVDGAVFSWPVHPYLVCGALFAIGYGSVLAFFCPSDAPLKIGNATSTPRNPYTIIDWLTRLVTGWSVVQARDGSRKAKNVRMVWGMFRFGGFGCVAAILSALALQNALPLLLIPALSLAAVPYRVAYALQLKHAETIGHALAGGWFGFCVYLTYGGM